ncbi:MAG TPA: zf-HC2 domain-containing protein, partial [Candidatus Angelobacter sp.]
MKHPENKPANPIYPEIHTPEVRPEDGLNQALAQMRAEQPAAETIEAAGDRVWQRLGQETAHAAVESIHGCEDVRLLLPEYRSGKLTAARALLVEAHLHECVDCRREAETGRHAAAVLEPWQHELPRGGTGGFRWAMAAAAVV